jgi:hypothetical protein
LIHLTLHSLLVGCINAIASHEILAQRSDAIEAKLDDADLKLLNKVHAMIVRQARLIQTFATKLRLTQQSHYTAANAAVVAEKAPGTVHGMEAGSVKKLRSHSRGA